MLCFDLTPYTLQPKEQRSVTVLRAETDRRTAFSAGAGAGAGAILFAVLAAFLPVMWVLPVIPVCAAAAVWLFARRSKQGMRLRNFDRLHRRARSRSGQFFIGTDRLDLSLDRMAVLHVLGPPDPQSWMPAWPATRPRKVARS